MTTKAAEIDGGRLDAIVLVDIAGWVDHGAGEFIGSAMAAVHDDYESADAYLDAIRAQGLVEEWNDYWDRCYRYGLEVVDVRVRPRVDRDAIAEDRAYGATKGGGPLRLRAVDAPHHADAPASCHSSPEQTS